VIPPDDCPSNCSICHLSQSEQDSCDSIDGRWIEAVSEYASSCDGCGELTLHELMIADEKTQLGYCASCARKMGIEEG